MPALLLWLIVIMVYIHKAGRINGRQRWSLRRRYVRLSLSFLLFLLAALLLMDVSAQRDEYCLTVSYLVVLLILRELFWLVLLLRSLLRTLGWRLRELSLGVHLLYFGKIRVPVIELAMVRTLRSGCSYMKLLSKTWECNARRGFASLICAIR